MGNPWFAALDVARAAMARAKKSGRAVITRNGDDGSTVTGWSVYYFPYNVEAAQGKAPRTCEWVYENGTRKASWQLSKELEDSFRINLMPDGRLVYVRGTDDPPADHVKKVINLRHITRQSEELQVDIKWRALSDLCSAVVTTGLPRFHLPSPGHLHNDLLAHWSRTHPQDDESRW